MGDCVITVEMDATRTPLTIESINDFIPLVRRLCGSQNWGRNWQFRGQTRRRTVWPLVPKVGRTDYFGFPAGTRIGEGPFSAKGLEEWQEDKHLGYLSPFDMRVFTEWKRRAIAFGPLPASEWECLALAQHYGLATRLLDWTWNPLVALFFAGTSEDTYDGAVYAWPFIGFLGERFSDLNDVRTYEPRPFDRRIAAQQGVFTYRPRPTVALEPAHSYSSAHNAFGTNLVEIIVPGGLKSTVLRDLHVFGISEATLFPDWQGLSGDLNRMSRPQIDRGEGRRG